MDTLFESSLALQFSDFFIREADPLTQDIRIVLPKSRGGGGARQRVIAESEGNPRDQPRGLRWMIHPVKYAVFVT